MRLILLLGCASPDTDPADSASDVADHGITEDMLGELPADAVVLEGPDVVVEPGADVMICRFGTYTGPTVGLHDVHTWQGAGGHHLQLMGTTTPAVDAPDGTVVDCTDDSGGFNMGDLEPIGVTNGGVVDGVEIGVSMPLPDGMAVELESGQRYVMQSHYLNTATEPYRVRDLAVLTVVPEEEVVTWAAPLIFNDSNFSIPPAGELTRSFECTTAEEWNFLYVLGHMHEWGTAFSVATVADEVRTPFYDIPEWDPVYRDAPQIAYYPDGALKVPAGTTFETTCSWFNDKDEPLEFPHEMCVTVNIVYPQKTTVICDAE